MCMCGDLTHTHTHTNTNKLPGSGMEKSDKLIGTKTTRDQKYSKISGVLTRTHSDFLCRTPWHKD